MSEQVEELTLCKDCQYWKQDDKFGVMGNCWGTCNFLMNEENNFMVVVYAREDGIMYTRNAFWCMAGKRKPEGPFGVILSTSDLSFMPLHEAAPLAMPSLEFVIALAKWLNELWLERGDK